MGLLGQGSEIREGVEEGVFEAFDEVGYYGVGLWGGVAVERVDVVSEVED